MGMKLDGETYLYEKNLQGDIVGIYNSSGTRVVSYAYDAWGNVVSQSYTDSSAYTNNSGRSHRQKCRYRSRLGCHP